MSTKVELNSSSQKELASSSSHVQFIPCSIEHDGEALLNTYFTKYVKEEKEAGDAGKEEHEKFLSGMFRGYPLTGSVMPVPEGYTGVVLKETRPGLNTDEARTVKGICQFKEFTFWNWDRKPSRGDKYQQAMDWADIADVIHNDK